MIRTLSAIDPEQAAALALSGGVTFFQYRNKNGTRRDIYETALRLRGSSAQAERCLLSMTMRTSRPQSMLMAFTWDRTTFRSLLPGASLARKALVGISTHSLGQARAAEASGADYIGFGPIFRTTTKDAGTVQGLENLRAVAAAVSIPVIAIGGITRDTIGDVMRAGAGGAAVIGAVCSARDIPAAAGDLIRAMRAAGTSRTEGGGR